MSDYERLKQLVALAGGQVELANRMEVTDRTIRKWLRCGEEWEADFRTRCAMERLEDEFAPTAA